MSLSNNLLNKLLDWNDKPEAYTRITLILLFGMFPVAILTEIYHSIIGIPIILGFIVIGVCLMFKRSDYENAPRSRT